MTGTCVEELRVDRHFEGGLSIAEERVMRLHLPDCAACRDRYERQLMLEKLDPRSAGAGARLARGLGISSAPPSVILSVRAWGTPIVAAAAVAAGVALFMVHSGDTSLAGFSARGGATESRSQILVYSGRAGEKPARAGEVIGAHEELAFAYENGAAKKYLMIYGVDEHHHVYWFHPAWSDATQNPVSVNVDRTAGTHVLPEAIAQDLDGDALEIHALFTDEPVSVKAVERWSEATPPGRAPEGAVESTVRFRVRR